MAVLKNEKTQTCTHASSRVVLLLYIGARREDERARKANRTLSFFILVVDDAFLCFLSSGNANRKHFRNERKKKTYMYSQNRFLCKWPKNDM